MKIAVIHANAADLLADYGSLLAAMAGLDHQVNAVAPAHGPEAGAGFDALGVEYAMYPLTPRGFTPFADITTLLHLKQVLFRIRPQLILSIGSKPMVYGSLAARMAWVGEQKRVYSLVTGPGYAFTGESGLKRRLLYSVAKSMFRAGFKSCDGILFRTAEEETFYRAMGVLQADARTAVADGPDSADRDGSILAFTGLITAD
jgi:hypothetical protein